MPTSVMMEHEEMINAIVRSRPARKRAVFLPEYSTSAFGAAAIVKTQNRLLEQQKHIENTFPKTNEPLA